MISLAIVVKTFLRPHKALTCVRSALAHTPDDVHVILVDDGRPYARHVLGRQERSRLPEDPRLHVLELPYDAGISAGRNAGVLAACELGAAQCAVFDDDFVLGADNHVVEGARYLRERDDLDVLGFGLRSPGIPVTPETPSGGVGFYASRLVARSGVLVRRQLDMGEASARELRVGSHVPCDICYNCLVASTPFLVAHPWDERLKVQEHWEYFWRLHLEGARVGVYFPEGDAPERYVSHQRLRRNGNQYSRMRGRGSRFGNIALETHGFRAYVERSRRRKSHRRKK